MYNPEDGQLYAVQRRTGTADDVLLKINTTTGAFIPNAFDTDGNGSGDRDYVVIPSVSSDARISPPDPAVQLRDIDDLAFAYSGGSGTLYGQAQSYSYRVEDLEPGRYDFRLKQIDNDGSFAFSPVVEVSVTLPQAYMISAAYPNPFNPDTRFTLQLSRRQHVVIHAYDVLGRRVRTLFDGSMEAELARVVRFEAGGLPG